MRSSPQGDQKRSRRQGRSSTYKVAISYATRIPLRAISAALTTDKESQENFQEAVQVLDTILRQHVSKQGCLLVRQSFFHNQPTNFSPLTGGVVGCRGFHSSFRATQGGLSLNIDVSTTMIVQPGPVLAFLLANQNLHKGMENRIDWVKAKRTLKSLRITTRHSSQEHKIVGLSDRICRDQTFTLKPRSDDPDAQPVELTVYEYFVNHRKIPLQLSGAFPCINVGKPKRPTYFPIELCGLVSLQRYTKSLTNPQRTKLVENSRQKPHERMKTLTTALSVSNYDADRLLASSGISISNQFTPVEGRVLPSPKLKSGNGEDFSPSDGKWNFNNKKLIEPVALECWAIVNFSARCDVQQLGRELIRCGGMKGIPVSGPLVTIAEDPKFMRSPAPDRVYEMFEKIKRRFSEKKPQFLLCILPERKNSDIYGPWKKRNLADEGIVTQCIGPPTRINDQQWPRISRYRAVVRTQSPKVELIDSLCKMGAAGTEDEGIFRELLLDFYRSSGQKKPDQIIIFRDGVSESQFNQVLNTELGQIMEACKLLDDQWNPKFMFIVAQKNHHTKFFLADNPRDNNVPPGTIIDRGVCHPRNNDFYMVAHAGRIGTSRPTHYHVLYDELGCTADDVQELVHNLSYVYQRSTTAISVVAPICYAHLAAAQMSQFMKFDELSETSSERGGVTSIRGDSVPALPKLHEDVCNSMFFC